MRSRPCSLRLRSNRCKASAEHAGVKPDLRHVVRGRCVVIKRVRPAAGVMKVQQRQNAHGGTDVRSRKATVVFSSVVPYLSRQWLSPWPRLFYTKIPRDAVDWTALKKISCLPNFPSAAGLEIRPSLPCSVIMYMYHGVRSTLYRLWIIIHRRVRDISCLCGGCGTSFQVSAPARAARLRSQTWLASDPCPLGW